jgi:hypothetical protein
MANAKAVPMWVIGTQICEALGLDPHHIRSLALRINSREGSVFELEGFLTDEAGRKLEAVMTQYRLVPCSVIDTPLNGAEEAEDG